MELIYKPITRTKLKITFKPEDKDQLAYCAEFESIDDENDYITKTSYVIDKIQKETKFKLCSVRILSEDSDFLDRVVKNVKTQR